MYLGFFHALEKAAVNTKTRKWAQAWVILISTLHLAVGFYSWRHSPVLYTRQQFVRLLHAGGGANHFYRKQHDDASQEVSSPTRFLSWRLEAPVLRYRFVKWGKHTHVWKCPCMATILWIDIFFSWLCLAGMNQDYAPRSLLRILEEPTWK
jgi:hypothetical protein